MLLRGATLSAYDPVAMPEAQRVLADLPGMSFAPDQSAALEGAGQDAAFGKGVELVPHELRQIGTSGGLLVIGIGCVVGIMGCRPIRQRYDHGA